MNLKCKINGVEYPLVQGVTFSEEYNETLDSATIMISQISQIKDLKPYDDVYIYDKGFNGYPNLNALERPCEFGYSATWNDYYFVNSKAPQGYKIEYYITFYDTVKCEYYRDFYLSDEGFTDTNSTIFVAHYDNDPTHFYINLDMESQENLVFDKKLSYYRLIPTDNKPVNNAFYKHFLVDQFSETLINIEQGLYKYKIELFSETKGLETIQLPNTSITQPRDIRKRKSVYQYMLDFVDMYSPKRKITYTTIKDFEYVKKYSIDRDLFYIFKDVYSPEFTLNSPNLRDILTQLMLTKDMIPYVKDGVIKALDITKRKGKFNCDKRYVNYINGSRSSANHCDNLRRNYTNALSQDNTCRRVEFLGFRNKDDALMTLDNMRLETRYPIYKINKILMCYYKTGIISVPKMISKKYEYPTQAFYGDRLSFQIGDIQGEVKSVSISIDNPNVTATYTTQYLYEYQTSNIDVSYEAKNTGNIETCKITVNYDYVPKNYKYNGEKRVFLCKQDITPLVKLNSERALLKADWNDFNNSNKPTTMSSLAQYRLCTVGYDIGDTKIEGWGTKYTYPEGWWDRQATYVENIYKRVEEITPYGIYQYGYLKKVIGGLEEDESFVLTSSEVYGPYSGPYSNKALNFKALFFQVDYNAFYNGCVVHSKDDGEDLITINDNSSSSLALLENDGLFQKEKINRFGNKATTITARYTNISQLQPLGSVYGDDEVIYHREYNIYDNCINCVYYATKDYVLKNYYTSVYAKHRPYNLMSYGESVNRAENKKLTILLSTQPQIKDKDLVLQYDNNFISKLFSFTKPSIVPKSIDVFEEPDRLNCGLISNQYLSDVNGFVSGNSLCFNMRMYDNVSGGVYIKQWEPSYTVDPTKDFTGSVQDWYIDVDSEETGFKENMSFDLFNYNNDKKFGEYELLEENNVLTKYSVLKALPRLEVKETERNNLISYDGKICKDNKEVIDMTFQIEPISAEPNKIIFSPWMMKLSDLLGGFNKFTQPTIVKNIWGYDKTQPLKYASSYTTNTEGQHGYMPVMILEFDKDFFATLDKKQPKNIEGTCLFNVSTDSGASYGVHRFISLVWNLNKITEFGNNFITVEVQQSLTEIVPFTFGKRNYYDNAYAYKLKQITRLGNYSTPEGKIAFSNFEHLTATGWAFGKESQLRYHTTQGELRYPEFMDFQFTTSSKPVVGGFETKNIISSTFGIFGSNAESKNYVQNMYLTLNNQEIKKEIVYNEYVDLPNKSEKLKVDDVIKTYDNKIVVDLTSIPKATKSIGVWFLDNILYSRKQESQTTPGVWSTDLNKSSYKFVFGVNLTEEDFTKGKVEITLSALNNRDFKVYDTYNNVIGRIK